MNKLRIRKMGVLSVAKIQGTIGVVIGLLIGIMYAFIIVIYTIFGASLVRGDAALAVGGGGVVLAIFALIGFPILYGIIGFVGGAIVALLYNLFSNFVGGIEIEVENIA